MEGGWITACLEVKPDVETVPQFYLYATRGGIVETQFSAAEVRALIEAWAELLANRSPKDNDPSSSTAAEGNP